MVDLLFIFTEKNMVSGTNRFYWISQISGWGFVVVSNLVLFYLSGKQIPSARLMVYSTLFIWGILFTHGERFFILKFNILSKKLFTQILFVFLFSLLAGFLIDIIIHSILFLVEKKRERWLVIAANGLNISSMIFVWSVFYFAFHYIRRYKLKEIQNLRLEAVNREHALNQLKAQLNPHFIFNSLNSIRALISENPESARDAVTMLSNLLRRFLKTHEQKEVTLQEELDIVEQYLGMEKIRFEDRLEVEYFISEKTLHLPIPPMTILALVENAIKHGISKNPGKGKISIHTQFIQSVFEICVYNTGTVQGNPDSTRIGLENTRKRIQLLYGEAAELNLEDTGKGMVRCCLRIPLKIHPKNKFYENHYRG